MTLMRPRGETSPSFALSLGAAVALDSNDFVVLGYSRELDDIESDLHPDVVQTTFVLRYSDSAREIIERLPQRLNDIWRAPTGPMYAVGEPRGVIEVTVQGLRETSIEPVPGTFASIWGPSDEHVFACGHVDPFWLYRRHGTWHLLELPHGVSGLWAVAGSSETDVYAVSDEGHILHFDGARVRRLDSPTTRWLTSAVTMPGGRMCIAGRDGTLLFGNTHGWRVVDPGTDEHLLKVVQYDNGASFVTSDGVWHFDGLRPPQRVHPKGGRWINRIGDNLMIDNDDEAWLLVGGQVVALDVTL